MAAMTHAKPIPEPLSVPLLGHVLWLDVDRPAQSLQRLAKRQGPIFRMELPGRAFVVVSDHALVDEVLDTSRFSKKLPGPLERLRALAGDGLFTAYNDEPNWAMAHRILMPAFGLEAMRGYHDMMLDVGLQMVDRWARLRPDEVVDVPEQMTRLTLDVIALCGFDYRLNSFYHDAMHPFVDSMMGALEEAMLADNRLRVVDMLMVRRHAQFERDIASMHGLVDRLIEERRAQTREGQARDLLGLMLNARDPLTGEGLSDENIRNQIVTFLIAGHETTSALLSFVLYALIQHPEVAQKARDEVDRVIGGPETLPSFEQLGALPYLDQILSEALRLWPPAPGFALSANAPTTLGGYAIEPDTPIFVLLPALHRDPAVWGPDAERFDPERFTPEAIAARPANAWKPFGNGMRACIGRQFALREAKLALALMLQRFDFAFADPDYTLEIGEALTFKPKNLRVRVQAREGRPVTSMLTRARAAAPVIEREDTPAVGRSCGATLHIGYGSNMGTTRQLASQLAAEARRMGYDVEIAPLDDWVDRPLDACDTFAVVTASYNGFPPDNAARFCAWLDALPDGALEGLNYVVFGCGHRDWAATFQAVPARIDARLEQLGAERVHVRGEGDARDDLVAQYAQWRGAMWPRVHASAGVAELFDGDGVRADALPSLEVELVEAPRATSERAQPMTVAVNRELVDMRAPFARSKRHIELSVPPGVSYRAGDHLVVTPTNAHAHVERFARRLGWDVEQVVVLRSDAQMPATFPVGRPLSLRALLTRHLELGKPVYPRHIAALIEHTQCPPERAKLAAWAEGEEAYREAVEARALSLWDVLDETPSCRPPLALVLSMLEPLAPRTYSIASASEAHPDRVHLTVSVVDAPARRGEGRFQGVCSNFLARQQPGDRVWAEVRTPRPAFVMPDDPRRPVVLISAGTGFAPMRGFIQQRAEARARGQEVGDVLVFSGCDRADVDLLYADALKAWADDGLIELHVAASRDDGDVRFVQHRVWAERARLGPLLARGVSVYVCGDGRAMAPAVRATLQRVYADATGADEGAVARWWEGCCAGEGATRYMEDVWSG